MKLVFQIVLMVVLTISFIGSFDEDDKDWRMSMNALCISSMAAELITFFVF
jgi:hypothetical protein